MYTTDLAYSNLEPDFSTMMSQVHEYVSDIMPNGITRFPILTYRRRTTPEANQVDDLHDEVLSPNRQWTDYAMPFHVAAQPKQQALSRFGIDEPRDLLVYFALPILEEQGLVVQQNAKAVVNGVEQDISPVTTDMGPLLFLVSIGDRIFFQGHQYSILTLHEDQFFGNTEIPVYLVAACQKWRPNVTTDSSLDDSSEAWRSDPLNPEYTIP